jgi:hypothetical protein
MASPIYAKSVTVLTIEYVEGKTQEMVVEVQLPTSHHGKKRTKKEIHKINTKTMKDSKAAKAYISDLRNIIQKAQDKSLKNVTLSSSGVIKVKLQIQGDGRFDILMIDGAQPSLISLVENTFAHFTKFKPLPIAAGQGELQLIVPVSFKNK